MFKSTFAMVVLAGAVAAETVATHAAASSIQRGCLLEQPASVGERSNEEAHYDFYLRSNFSNAMIPSNYRIVAVVTCVDYANEGKVTGFTF